MSQAKRRWWLLGLTVSLVLIIDQITKRVVIGNLRNGEAHDLIPSLSPLFQITRSHNTGASFGLLPQAGDLFLLIALLVTVFMLYYYPRIEDGGRFQRLASGLIIGGALGNAIDRIDHGFVIDFIHYQIPNLISNVSNLADHAIVLGVVLIFIDSWLSERRKTSDIFHEDTEFAYEQPIIEGDMQVEDTEHRTF